MAKSNKLVDKKFIKDYVKNNLDYVDKYTLLNIYKKYNLGESKSSLTKAYMLEVIKSSKINLWDIYQDLKDEFFGISAYELYELLDIDKKIKDKMIKEGLLSVAYTREVKTRFKKYINAPYFLLEDLYKINKDDFEEFKLSIKPASAKQLAAIEKAREIAIKNRTCCTCKKVVGSKESLIDGECYVCSRVSSEKAQSDYIKCRFESILKNKDKYIILDTETTGLEYDDEIIEIAIIDMDSNIVLNTLIYTEKPISDGAASVHYISSKELVGKPTIKDLNTKLNEIFKDKTVLIFNEDFDTRMLYQSGFEGDIKTLCVMNLYADFRNSDRWISLQNALEYEDVEIVQDHRALGDCRCVLNLIKKIVNG